MIPTYTIYIPVYNEEKIIYKNILTLHKVLKILEKELKIKTKTMVMNDGSIDNTQSEMYKLIEKYNDISVSYYPGPSRRENLLRCIDMTCDTDYLVFMDCDLATDLMDLRILLMNIPFYDIVSGSRYITSSKTKRHINRKIISFCFNNAVRLLFRSKVRDHECGFKALKTTAFRKIIEKTEYGQHKRDRRMFWDSEMWVYAQNMDMDVLEIPVVWKESDKSALRFKTELSMIKYVFKMWIGRKWMKKKLQS